MNYQTVAIFNKRNVDYGRVTDTTIEEVRQTANACIAENTRLYNEALRLHAEMLKSAEIVYGAGAELRYIREHKVPLPPDVQRSFKSFVEKVNDARRKLTQLTQQTQRKQAEAEERQRRSEIAQKGAATRARNRELAARWDAERDDIICSD